VGKIQKNEFLKQNEEIPVYTSWNKPDMANTSTTVTSCWCPTIRQKSTFVSIKETEKKIRTIITNMSTCMIYLTDSNIRSQLHLNTS
jgi:hypothetical protein